MDVRVFLVEDLAGARSLMEELLGRLGAFRVVGSAHTEAEANLWLEENPGGWDLAVIDLVLHEGNGMGVVAKCESLETKGIVVVYSAYATPGVRKHCLNLGASAVFDKIETEPLIAFCNELLNRENSGP